MPDPISNSRAPLLQGPRDNHACSMSVIPGREAELTLLQTTAGRVADKGYAFAVLVDANAGVTQGNLTARTSDSWLADLFRRIVSWIRDGHDNRQIRDELHSNLSQHVLHCISDTEASLGRLTISAGYVARKALTAPDMLPVKIQIDKSIEALRQHRRQLENIHLNLHAIVAPDTRQPLDMRDIAWIADNFLALSRRSHSLNDGALSASMSAGIVACGLPLPRQEPA